MLPFAWAFLIGLGLSMDCFAVSLCSGMGKTRSLARALRIAVFFGSFQALMPVAGWLAGSKLSALIGRYDHWCAAGLLVFIGGRMIISSFKEEEGCDHLEKTWVLLALSVATSIDALAAGMSFGFLNQPIIVPAVIIGLVTFCVSLTGLAIGNRAGAALGKRAELGGGLLLIAIALFLLTRG
ncbi:MAG: manganese efflux pump MntP family protein [Deltaproteobacteria bacterium]